MEPSSSSSSSNSTDPRLMGFYHSLTKEIDALESTLQTDNNDFMSIQFLESVLNLKRFCHNQMTHFALTLKLPVSGKWSDEYMEESDKLLKAIRDIKDSVERIIENYYENNCLSVTTFLDTHRVLDHQACNEMIRLITDCIAEAELLEEENTPLSTDWRNLGLFEKVWSETVLRENSGFNGIIYAARNVTNTLLRILLYGLVACWPEYKFTHYVYERGVHYDSSFMVSTDRLQKRVESEICKLTRPTGILWYEFWRSKMALVELRGKFETKRDDLQGGGVVFLDLDDGGVNGIVEKLKGYIGVLKEGGETERIIEQIDDFIDEIIEARKKVCDYHKRN